MMNDYTAKIRKIYRKLAIANDFTIIKNILMSKEKNVTQNHSICNPEISVKLIWLNQGTKKIKFLV